MDCRRNADKDFAFTARVYGVDLSSCLSQTERERERQEGRERDSEEDVCLEDRRSAQANKISKQQTQ